MLIFSRSGQVLLVTMSSSIFILQKFCRLARYPSNSLFLKNGRHVIQQPSHDPKVRPGGVDVARHWQGLGFLLIYLSARPDMQQRRVTAWLAQHNFPHGLTFFVDGFSADPLRQKAQILQRLTQEKIAGSSNIRS
ncbi:unnamed protein product [Protopolystoma xenopodis]|uniref:LNS2/PITP domain-containing protein n=1 Tax=Protopolystoma xenopodis TaxID=117903 RepID=A0A3S5ACY0_9PLAT|nr:unnamed protein product [Protopolystoma xenopodis]